MGTLCRERGCKVKRKRYSRKFQRMAVERMRNCEDVGELADALGMTEGSVQVKIVLERARADKFFENGFNRNNPGTIPPNPSISPRYYPRKVISSRHIGRQRVCFLQSTPYHRWRGTRQLSAW